MPTVFAESGAFRDKDKAAAQMANPMSIIEMEDGALSKKKVEMKHAMPLNQAFFTLYEQLKHEQEVQASAPNFQSGDPSNIPETNKALVNLDSFADRPLAINIDAVEACLERVFKNVIKFQSVTYDEEKLLLIDTDPEKNVRVNQPEVLTGEDGQVQVTNINNNISNIDYDISLVPGSMSPLDRANEYMYAKEAVSLGAPPEFAMGKMPVEGIDQVVKDVNTIRTLQEAVTERDKAIEEMQKQLETINNQFQKAKQTAVDVNYAAKFEVEYKRIQDLVRGLNRELRNAQRQNTITKKHVQKTAKENNQVTADKEA